MMPRPVTIVVGLMTQVTMPRPTLALSRFICPTTGTI